MSKRCSTCHRFRPLSEFNVRRAAPDGLQSRCRACSAAWYAEHRAQHKANVSARNQRVRSEYRRRIVEYLLANPCVDCGEQDVRVLDFDHEDPADKADEVVRLAASAVAWTRITAEISKCSVRCANCHRRRTAKMFGYWRHGAESDRRAELAARSGERLRAILG